jgi:hypothetical protein
MALITYTDKEQYEVNPLPDVNKFTADDANEIKTVVNRLAVIGGYRGDWAGTNAMPTTGGGYTAGAPGIGDRWRLTDTLSIGGNIYAPGTIIEAAINEPGQTLANWNFYAMQLI